MSSAFKNISYSATYGVAGQMQKDHSSFIVQRKCLEKYKIGANTQDNPELLDKYFSHKNQLIMKFIVENKF